MQIINKSRKQWAVYWAPAGGVNPDGQRRFADPVEKRVRWEDRQEQFLGMQGEERTSRSVVMAGEDVETGGVLWLSSLVGGTITAGEALAELDSTTDPFANTGAQEIYGFYKLPTMRATKFYRAAFT